MDFLLPNISFAGQKIRNHTRNFHCLLFLRFSIRNWMDKNIPRVDKVIQHSARFSGGKLGIFLITEILVLAESSWSGELIKAIKSLCTSRLLSFFTHQSWENHSSSPGNISNKIQQNQQKLHINRSLMICSNQ